MPRLLFALTAATVFALSAAAGEKDVCFGTTIHFVESPKDAAAQAKKDEKLVMILHVSGNFEDPRFT